MDHFGHQPVTDAGVNDADRVQYARNQASTPRLRKVIKQLTQPASVAVDERKLRVTDASDRQQRRANVHADDWDATATQRAANLPVPTPTSISTS
jgi:sRNA-binding protein